MKIRARLVVCLVGIVGLAAILFTGISGLPGYGHYPGPYGDYINALAPYQRHVTNAVSAVNFDYRGLDTLGEEFILFAAVAGLVLLLRSPGVEAEDRPPIEIPNRPIEPASDGVRWLTFGLVAVVNLFGTYMVLHGNTTPGGGFQGGAILGTASMMVYLGAGYRTYRRSTAKQATEIGKSLGAGIYALTGLAGMVAGGAFLQNVLPLGRRESLLSGGTIPVINFGVGLEVAAGFALLFLQFIKETRKQPSVEEK
ncbi:MAG TPA: MnhB domain-containing protein [Chthoniobacteraceae bacterium]|jgi:multicomponent Na+:H+ antiporter subunit B|nr:MnhB domain-containing protein [Chthoniobacteraceae bacterium]